MQPILLFYVNLLLCGIVILELLITLRKKSVLKLYFLVMAASLFTLNFYAVTGISDRVQFMVAKFARMVYVCTILLTLIHLVHRKIPKWIVGFIICSAVLATSARFAFYDQIVIKAAAGSPNHVFTVGAEFISPKTGIRYLILGLSVLTLGIVYNYYRQLLMKLNRESAHYKHMSRWVISLVIPLFLLVIFGILGNLRVFSESLSSYLFAVFSYVTICSFVLRPRFLDSGAWRENGVLGTGKSRKRESTVFNRYSPSGSTTSVSATRPTWPS